MRKISIIGANSSLAKSFIKYLESKKDIDLHLYGTHTTCDWKNKNYKCIDLSEFASINQIDYSCDQLYIFSGLTGSVKGMKNYSDFIDVNEKNLVSILEGAVRNKATCRIVYPSSRLVYKSTGEILSEHSELECRSIYAVNKIAAEQYLKTYNNIYGIDYTIFRIAIPFGTISTEKSQYGIVSILKKQAIEKGVITLYGKGDGYRTFTHIKDICNIFYSAVLLEETKNEIYNIGGHKYSLMELASLIAHQYMAKIEMIEWPELDKKVDVPDGWLDSTKLDSILNFTYQDIKLDDL